MNSIFVTGTDTGSGKTIVTGLLAKYLADQGLKIITQKWIQTGSKGFPEDITVHLRLMGKSKSDVKNLLKYINPYCFKFPASPHLSAKLEGKKINLKKIIDSYNHLKQSFDSIIVEGLGGALVPYNNKNMVIEITKKLKIPAIIVAKNQLGCINHTLITIEALKKRNINILGIIFNDHNPKKKDIVKDDNMKIIQKLSKVQYLGSLPWTSNINILKKSFKPIGGKIVSKLRTVKH
ncbi:dethiobiotin synthase [bacterium]